MLVLKLSSIMAMADVPLRIIFVEVSLGFQTGCRTRQIYYLQSSLLILDGAIPVEAVVAPKASISEEVEHSSAVGAKVGDKP